MAKTTLILIFLSISIFAQQDTLFHTQKFWNDLSIIFIEYDTYKLLTDSLTKDNQVLNQKLWLKDYEIANCDDKIIELKKRYENYEPPKAWFDNFATGAGFTGLVILIAFIIGVLL